MSTPKIDLRNMLDEYDRLEELEDRFNSWVEFVAEPKLAITLRSFKYSEFDSAANDLGMISADSIVEWLFAEAQDDYEVFEAIARRDWGDVDFRQMVKSYVEQFVSLADYIEYIKINEGF